MDIVKGHFLYVRHKCCQNHRLLCSVVLEYIPQKDDDLFSSSSAITFLLDFLTPGVQTLERKLPFAV